MLLLDMVLSVMYTFRQRRKIQVLHTMMLSNVWISLISGNLGSHAKNISQLCHRIEVQCDLADFIKTAEENDGYRYGFCAIDVLSRHAWAIPIKTKTTK